jgi:hypothetical protein
MLKIQVLFAALMVCLSGYSQTPLSYYLPTDVEYDESIPDPNQHTGYQIGDWHFNYDQVLSYARIVAHSSDRVTLIEYARSWENRPLVYLVFTSPKNHKQLDTLRKNHCEAALSGKSVETNPLVIQLNYGIHGNESSATHSSLLSMYYLAAAQGERIDALLESSIILVDPCLNPDGFSRHAAWMNANQGKKWVSDPQNRSFSEPWPGSRTNHYLFDMNRDYLSLVNPESAGRISNYHKWLPNIYTDHHEMGSSSTFFFQPGVESRNNPLTPKKNYELTNKIAEYHVKSLDDQGLLYFTGERFDDYFFGKGSAYPDVNAGIGILFEQAGLRGLVRETQHGKTPFSQAIKNQFSVTLSSLKAGTELKDELLTYQRDFYTSAMEEAEADAVRAYIYGEEYDATRLQLFTELLKQHQIESSAIKQAVTINNHTFNPGKAFVVKTRQRQYRMVKTIFETVHQYRDTTFYDVSTWTLPYAFNLKTATIKSSQQLNQLLDSNPIVTHDSIRIHGTGNYALLMNWDDYFAPAALHAIQELQIRSYVASEPFRIEGINYDYGTIMIPLAQQTMNPEQILLWANTLTKKYGVRFTRISSGRSEWGSNLGSSRFIALNPANVAIICGKGTYSYHVGEAWHQLDQRYQMPTTLLEAGSLSSADLNRYSCIVLLERASNFSTKDIDNLKQWVNNGGTLLSYGYGLDFLKQEEFLNISTIPAAKPVNNRDIKYQQRFDLSHVHRIPGAIYEIEPDLSHPLFYGYHDTSIPVFKDFTIAIQADEQPFVNPARYSSSPLLSGYSSKQNVERIQNSAYCVVGKMGKGKVIYLVDNPNFRGAWYGTSKIFANAIFFGATIR